MSTQNHNHHHLPKFHLLLITTFSLLIRCRTTSNLPVQYYEPEDLPSELFQQWSEKHGKSYEHITFEESLKRFENFKRNLKYVVDHNSDQTGFTVGLNRFSDLSNDEFKVGYLSGVKRWVQWVQLNNSRASSVLTCDAPSYLDWREMGKVSPDKDYWIVKNSWGTSWGMDGYIYIKRNTNLPYGVCSINALASYPLLTTLASSPLPSSSSTPSPASPPYISPPQPLPPAAAPPPSSPPPPPSPPPSSPPPPPPSPPPSSPPPPPSPPPPSPTPSSRCGDFTYCLPGQTCCCLYESFGFCLIQGCCRYSKAVCCPESDYCCPLEYPICDTDSGLCLKDSEDKHGIALSKKKWANPTLPWIKLEEMTEVTYQPLRWRRNGYATAH